MVTVQTIPSYRDRRLTAYTLIFRSRLVRFAMTRCSSETKTSSILTSTKNELAI